jgi:hypothetical protein
MQCLIGLIISVTQTLRYIMASKFLVEHEDYILIYTLLGACLSYIIL